MRHVLSASLFAIALTFATGAVAQIPDGYPADYSKLIEAGKKEGKVVIYSTTDAVSANPLVKDFEALYPGIKVEYSDLNSTELYNRFIAESAANNGTGDVIWSSAMDLQVKLVADGQAAAYASPEIKALPKWAVWKDAAYGTTYEPIAFVYNKRLVPEADVPKDHTALLKLLDAKPDAFKGKITAYDPERSGVGYLFCNEDIKNFPAAWALFKTMGKTGAKLYTSAGAMMSASRPASTPSPMEFSAPMHSAAPRRTLTSASCCRPTTPWSLHASPSSPSRRRARTPPGCSSIICCQSAARRSSPRRTYIRCAPTSRAKPRSRR